MFGIHLNFHSETGVEIETYFDKKLTLNKLMHSVIEYVIFIDQASSNISL